MKTLQMVLLKMFAVLPQTALHHRPLNFSIIAPTVDVTCVVFAGIRAEPVPLRYVLHTSTGEVKPGIFAVVVTALYHHLPRV